ncbi:uncharacterized protein BDV17DRAFT_291798 [Aspergillus undulatus]|uniref:uncharacterized protein n=1 Tax=Aspergillus undulatus TaxID=1810928 RepID=UPI003CCD753F
MSASQQFSDSESQRMYKIHVQDQAEEYLEPESQTIEQRYRPRPDDPTPPIVAPDSHKDNENIRRILERCREFEGVNFNSTQLQEEQERQLAPEIEQERQVQRPSSATPVKHSLHPDVHLFATTGTLQRESTAFIPAFQPLKNTSAARYLELSEFPSQLLVTQDFASTVQKPKGPSSLLDDYQRPVQWVLTRTESDKNTVKCMIIISPWEANKLHGAVLQHKATTMHLYAPRQNRSYAPLDALNLFTIPSRPEPLAIPIELRIQLNLFAGQLYISSMTEYREICEFLEVASTSTTEGMVVAAGGFIIEAPEGYSLPSGFNNSPLKILKVLMAQIRKDGQEIDKSHLGKILDGKLLCEDDFEQAENLENEVEGGSCH